MVDGNYNILNDTKNYVNFIKVEKTYTKIKIKIFIYVFFIFINKIKK